MKDNPWIARYGCGWTDTELDRLIEIPARRIVLGAGSVEADSQALRVGLESFFLSSAQIRLLVRRLHDVAYGHAARHFPSLDVVVSGLYSPWRNCGTSKAMCLTGLAGVGKSELIAAVRRMLPAPVAVNLPGHRGLHLVAAWFINLRDGASPNTLLRQWIEPPSEVQPDFIDTAESKKKDRHH